ncbi:MAG: hypothetical protein WA012_10420, partial [Rhodoferax sp.]|uniref:hypothetical protein n=1 Tax=Rhodoferax sp. TaxID=50421 RepID=UPI003BAF8F50
HGRASSSDFDTLIFQPFGRCPHLFLPQAAVNSTGLLNSASPSTVRIVWLVQLKSLTGLGQLQSLANDRYQETNLGVGVGVIVSFNDLQFERLLL